MTPALTAELTGAYCLRMLTGGARAITERVQAPVERVLRLVDEMKESVNVGVDLEELSGSMRALHTDVQGMTQAQREELAAGLLLAVWPDALNRPSLRGRLTDLWVSQDQTTVMSLMFARDVKGERRTLLLGAWRQQGGRLERELQVMLVATRSPHMTPVARAQERLMGEGA